MSDQLAANKELVRRLVEEGFNAGRPDVVDELVSSDVVTHNPIILDAPTGPGSVRGGATGRPGSLRAFFIWRVADGRLVESWGVADRFDFLQQLGIVPSDDELAARMPPPGT